MHASRTFCKRVKAHLPSIIMNRKQLAYRRENPGYASFFSMKEGIGEKTMETRIALIGIIVENPASIEALNHLLHEYGNYIIGRMGIPYREKKVNIISVAIDAPQDVINALSGKIGRLDGIGAKTVYSNITGMKE